MKDSDFCPTCKYYLYLDQVGPRAVLPLPAGPIARVGPLEPDGPDGNTLRRICRNCGYQEDKKGGLILEFDLKEKISEGYKILMNEFTKYDPTLQSCLVHLSVNHPFVAINLQYRSCLFSLFCHHLYRAFPIV